MYLKNVWPQLCKESQDTATQLVIPFDFHLFRMRIVRVSLLCVSFIRIVGNQDFCPIFACAPVFENITSISIHFIMISSYKLTGFVHYNI